ncbi:MAG: ABC-2 family transporter protein [Bacilli bacterium]|nr:ABC-2 family transporter protein [Bacilli bacterium]
MIGYLRYFKLTIIAGLQYRISALSGLLTQFFWGLLYIFIYKTFYSYTAITSINFKELMCYVWLNQAFITLTFLNYNDNEITNAIKNGAVSYELCRPYDLYWWWFIKLISKRYSKVILRFLPIIIFSFLLPKPYNLSLPVSINAFILFLITLFLGSIIITTINIIVNGIVFFTLDDKGISSLIYNIGSLFSGILIPLPLLPKYILNICNYLPFKYIGDLSFRVYSGNIGITNAINNIIISTIWIVIFVIIGKFIFKIALKKVSIQGG